MEEDVRRETLKRVAHELAQAGQKQNAPLTEEQIATVLEENLMNRHQVHPVHSLQEMELLHQRFPKNIIQYNAFLNGQIVAGMTFYVTPQVVHGQYCSSNDIGKQFGAVDAIHDYVMHHDFPDYPYMDFGRSTEGDGSILNEGLVAQKEGFGGRTICYDTYEWDV